jgi:hypothetical protein
VEEEAGGGRLKESFDSADQTGMKFRYLALAALLLAPCSAFCKSKARLYNLQTGEVTSLEYKRGKIWGTFTNGEKLAGEYSVLQDGAIAWGSLFNGPSSATSLGFATSNTMKGTAIMTGDGLVIECEFLTSGSHGSGACRDQAGNLFKLMF